MSKTFFNISEQKTNVINFIKKHKNILCLDDDCKAITAEFIGEFVKTNNKEFFHLVRKVRLKFGENFYIFIDNYNVKKHHMIGIWFPAVFCKVASDKAIKEFCGSKSFGDVIERCCNWYNMTPKRWETFEAVFDFYDKKKSSSKKTTKKTTKKTAKKTTNTADKAKALTLDDFKLFLNDIVFID